MVADRWLQWLVAGLGTALLLAIAVTEAAPREIGPDRDAATMMVRLVNEVRADHDLPPLTPAEDVTLVAETWSARMAAGAGLEHNPSFGQQICCYRVATENVAWSSPPRIWTPGDVVARTTRDLHEGLLSSPGHRANILDGQVDQIGIGVHVGDDGSVWITQNFRRHDPTS